MKKRITIVDIANTLGITPSAVSKAFSDHPRISVSTKKAVFETAKTLGYQPNNLATGLRKGKSGLIGVLVPGIHYSFFATAIKGIEEILSDKGFNVIIAQSKDDYAYEKRQLNGLLKAHVEGIIASMSIETKDHQHYKDISRSTPLVLFDRTYEDAGVSTVTIDDFAGAVKAVDHLVEMGYTRIAHIAGHDHIQPFAKRIEGYKNALQKHGLPFREDYIIQGLLNKEEGVKAAEVFFNLEEPPDAIFAASDYPALGVIQVARARGISIPGQLGIVGFSNEELSSQVSPSITTVDQFSETLGKTAAISLIDQLKCHDEGREFEAQRHVLTPRLIIRESSSRLVHVNDGIKR